MNTTKNATLKQLENEKNQLINDLSKNFKQ